MVVERGAGMNSMMRERDLEQAGELRQKSSFGKGQMVAADYTELAVRALHTAYGLDAPA